MVDFANSFPDAHIFNQLGDEVWVIPSSGANRKIKAVFDWEYEEEELADFVSMKIPYIEVTDVVNGTILGSDNIRYNGETYAIHHRFPVDTGIMRIVLRAVRSVV